MKIRYITSLIFFLNTFLGVAWGYDNVKQEQEKKTDSLLEVSLKEVYKNPENSIELGLSVYENSSYSKKMRLKALTLISLGYASKRDYRKSLEYIKLAEEFSSDYDSKVLEIQILFQTGILYQQLKVYDKSIEYMEKIEQLALAFPYKDSVRGVLANSYVVKGFVYKDNLNCDIALDFFKRGIGEYQKLNRNGRNGNLSIIYYNVGNCYTMLGEYGSAKNSFTRSMSLAKLENANSLMSFAEKGLAEVYTLEGKYEKAIALLDKALERSIDVGDLVLNSSIYKGLFENYLALNQSENYQKFYNLYIQIQTEIKISERNSISDTIDENYNIQNDKILDTKERFKSMFRWVTLLVIVLVVGVIFLERKNRKDIKELTQKVETTQSTSKMKV